MPSPASGSTGDVVGDGDPEDESGSVGVPVGVDELVAGAEEDVLVDGDDCVGVDDRRALVVGLAERDALGVVVAVPRLVPVE